MFSDAAATAKYVRTETRLSTEDSWANPDTLADHFKRHGGDVEAISADDYAAKASEFLSRAAESRLPMKIDEEGTIRAYDATTREFASYRPDGTTRTYYKVMSDKYWDKQPGVLQ
jgi:pyocin large subunit-like protein